MKVVSHYMKNWPLSKGVWRSLQFITFSKGVYLQNDLAHLVWNADVIAGKVEDGIFVPISKTLEYKEGFITWLTPEGDVLYGPREHPSKENSELIDKLKF